MTTKQNTTSTEIFQCSYDYCSNQKDEVMIIQCQRFILFLNLMSSKVLREQQMEKNYKQRTLGAERKKRNLNNKKTYQFLTMPMTR